MARNREPLIAAAYDEAKTMQTLKVGVQAIGADLSIYENGVLSYSIISPVPLSVGK